MNMPILRRLNVLVLCMMLFAVQAVGAAENGPTEAEELPTFEEDQNLVLDLEVRNPYDRAIKIDPEGVEVACACTDSILGSYFLLPGETTTLSVEIENRNLSGVRTSRAWLYNTDPELPAIELEWSWRVIPHVVVDSLPVNAPVDQRPEDRRYRDIYYFKNASLTDEVHRLRKMIRLERGDGEALAITDIDYAGELWTFTQHQRDNGAIILVAEGRRDVEPEPGLYEEVLTLTTNHPKKSEIDLYFDTMIEE